MRARTLAAVVLAMSLIVAAAEAQVPDTHIVGTDYAFLHPPDTLPAGQHSFSFENRGTVRHEMSIALLSQGATLQQAMEVFTHGGPRKGIVEKAMGILLAPPADTSGGRLLTTLIRGRTYAIVCNLRDKPDAQPHVMLGMIASFVVK